MKVRFDEKADALYMRLDDSKIFESEEVQPGIVLDFNERNQVVGIEIRGNKGPRTTRQSSPDAIRGCMTRSDPTGGERETT